MYMHEKSYAFSNAFSPQRFEGELPVERVHKWVMANLSAGSREEIRGLFPAGTPAQIGAETNNRFALHRYKTFIYGIVEFRGMLYEYLPGSVRVYACLPYHLMQRTIPAIANYPSVLHVMYVPAPWAMVRHYWQDVQTGKMGLVPARNNYHGRSDQMPPINGAIIRNVFSLYASFLRRLDNQEKANPPLSRAESLYNSKGLWVNFVQAVPGEPSVTQTPAQEKSLRALRDGPDAFDPPGAHLQRLWIAANKLDATEPYARERRDEFYTLLRSELTALVQSL
jgi:hypothetical protein